MREITAAGLEALTLASSLLQRVRLADPSAGVWEAADVQWWWRLPSAAHDAEKVFWVDDDGPIGGVLLTTFNARVWQCDPVSLPGRIGAAAVWERALDLVTYHAPAGFDVPVSDGDELAHLVRGSGLTPAERDSTGWLSATDRPAVEPPCAGFTLVDRTRRTGTVHPLGARNGSAVEQRLAQCALYDPHLDLAVESPGGRTAAYSLYWFDPVTKVGLIEPVRVEEEFQRLGLARAMLTEGIARLAARGAQRIKVSWSSEGPGALYQGVGFIKSGTTTWWRFAR